MIIKEFKNWFNDNPMGIGNEPKILKLPEYTVNPKKWVFYLENER